MSEKNVQQVNDESCATPHLTKDLELNDHYENNEVWSSALFFKYIDYENEQDYASKSIDYVNNEVWGNLGVAVLIKKHSSRKYTTIFWRPNGWLVCNKKRSCTFSTRENNW